VAPVHLIASSDDFLLEEQLREIIRAASEKFGGIEPEVLSCDITPEDLATELCSPSLFSPQRVLVVPDVRDWFVAAAKGKAKKASTEAAVDTGPVVHVLKEGLSEDLVLVLGACCPSNPKGELVKAAGAAGSVQWLEAPKPPKPWEDVEVSEEQQRVLRDVLARAVGDVQFTHGALKLLIHRLGYAPRLLIQEAKKLASASVGQEVDEDLVRALCFPKERSLEVVRDAVFAKQAAPILDLLVAAEFGIQVRNWDGQAVRAEVLPNMIAGQVGALLQQMLYLRRLVVRIGIEPEMAPDRTRDPKWYPYRFKNGAGPTVLEALAADAPSPVVGPGKRPPTLFTLGNLFKGASRFTDDELISALARYGEVEAELRGKMPVEALSVWLASSLQTRG
jgi:hypothetical protein